MVSVSMTRREMEFVQRKFAYSTTSISMGILPQQRDVIHFRHLPINVRPSGKGNRKNSNNFVAADVSWLASQQIGADSRPLPRL
jgi:hypothetical protein